MPRRNGGGARRAPSAPARPSVPSTMPRSSGPSSQQARGASTAAPGSMGSQQHPHTPAPQAQQPGLFGQMASTAAGVAVGSSIGHAIGGLFSGGGSAPAESAQDNSFASAHQQPVAQQGTNNWGQQNCENDARAFTQCMNENNGSMQTCSWFLENLKACQSAASQY